MITVLPKLDPCPRCGEPQRRWKLTPAERSRLIYLVIAIVAVALIAPDVTVKFLTSVLVAVRVTVIAPVILAVHLVSDVGGPLAMVGAVASVAVWIGVLKWIERTMRCKVCGGTGFVERHGPDEPRTGD
jgi:hypothetical protein